MKYKALTLVLALMIALPMLAAIPMHVSAAPTDLGMINSGPDGYPLKWTAGPDTADQGTYYFNFTTDDTDPGDTFIMNITIANTNLCKSWGIGVVWENATVDFVSAWRPSDHAFAPVEGAAVPVPQAFDDVDANHRIFKWGFGYIMPSPAWTFNGSGVLCQIQWKIQDTVVVNPVIHVATAVWTFDPDWTTVYYYPSGQETPNFASPAAYFKYEWLEPEIFPDFYVTCDAAPNYKVGDSIPFTVGVKNVAAAWDIIGFQFELWFNTTFLYRPETYTIDPWMSGFANNGETVMGIAYEDYHLNDPEIPVCYNKWAAVIFLVPDPVNGWTAPFPSGTGPLFHFQMTAILETVFPVVETTILELHNELVYNSFGQRIPTSPLESVVYTAPQKVLGLSIDLYACRDGVIQEDAPELIWVHPKYDGAGPNMPTDMYQPQAELDLQANVTYNEWPVQQKLVGFVVVPPQGSGIDPIYRENYTDVSGTAWVKVRLPWPCVDPTKLFGEWTVTVTVEVAKQIVNDTMTFKYWWPVELLNVTGIDVTIDKYQPSPMKFTVWYRTYRMDPIPLLLTVDAYDNLGFHIGSAAHEVPPVGWDSYTYCQFIYYVEEFDLPTPTNAVVGPATVYANAWDTYPWLGGTPYCPEVSGTFFINVPP